MMIISVDGKAESSVLRDKSQLIGILGGDQVSFEWMNRDTLVFYNPDGVGINLNFAPQRIFKGTIVLLNKKKDIEEFEVLFGKVN